MIPKNRNNSRMKKIVSVIAAMLLVILYSCQYETIEPLEISVDGPLSYELDIAPIFEDNCTGCHAGAISPDLRTDKSWSELTSNNLVDPADPEGSELMEKINADHGVPLSALQKAQVLKWIQDGAENN